MAKKLPEYLDNAATTSVDKRVLDAMLPYFSEIFGNASSNHIYGRQAKKAIEEAREHVARIINAEPKEMYFTSGATESINLALKGYIEANPEKGNHIITVKTEHKAVLETCAYLEEKGVEVTYLDVDHNGLISLEDLTDNIRPNTALIAVMYVNNEIGIIQDIKRIGEIARENEIVFFCDATQAVGKVPVDVIKDNIDMLCLSGHKMNGPKGVGALYIKNGITVAPLIHGGGQEKGMRGGTYNSPLIVGLGKACEIYFSEFDLRQDLINEKREKWINYFESNGYGVVNFKGQITAPHIISIELNGPIAEDFLVFNAEKLVASTGSACSSNVITGSHVITAVSSLSNKSLRITL